MSVNFVCLFILLILRFCVRYACYFLAFSFDFSFHYHFWWCAKHMSACNVYIHIKTIQRHRKKIALDSSLTIYSVCVTLLHFGNTLTRRKSFNYAGFPIFSINLSPNVHIEDLSTNGSLATRKFQVYIFAFTFNIKWEKS